jgi:hypothetical protein
VGDSARPQVLSTSADDPVDPIIAPFLRDDERVLVRAGTAKLTRVSPDRSRAPSVTGTLFLTDRRLMNVDGDLYSIELADITELAISGDQLLVSLRGSLGAILDLDSPQEFRSSVAAAISAARGR